MIALRPEGLQEARVPPERRGLARDAVRMLVTERPSGRHEHARFLDLPRFVRAGDLLIVNDSTTLPAALAARRHNGEQIALHISTMIDARLWIAEPRAGVERGETLLLRDGARATVVAPVDTAHPRLWYVDFDLPLPMYAYLAKNGEPIRYGYVSERLPLTDYQTMFARVPGSAEMPSAARPFTPAVVRSLRRAGARFATVTLLCGVSSFEQPERPGPERYVVPPQTARAIAATRHEERRVIAIGTTVVRALESSVHEDQVIPSSGWTDLVLGPSHRLRAVDALLTGFHEPMATHMSLLHSFLDEDLLSDAYERAAAAQYTCHEFGDVHLIV